MKIKDAFPGFEKRQESAAHPPQKRQGKGSSSSGKTKKRAAPRASEIKSKDFKRSGIYSPRGRSDPGGLERENRLLIQQLIQASSMIQEMEEKLYKSSRKETLAKVMVAGLLHDLRNPLAVISSCAQSCLEEEEEEGPLWEKLQMIMESVNKASNLAKSLLDHTRTSVLDYGPVNINRTLMTMWKMSALQSAPRKVNFAADLEKTLPEITGSQENLERVFLNIFMNAIHAVSGKGHVKVQTRFLPLEKRIGIRISDDGPGIPEEQRARIFEPFYTTKEKGTGLGLNISQSLILQHGGQITVESEVGRGTTFCIKLPLTQDGPP